MTLSDAGAASAPPDVASSPPTTDLPAAWHTKLVAKAKSFINKEARRLNFTAPAGVADVTRRLNGYAWTLWGPASPDYDTLWQISEYAIDEIYTRGRQPTFEDFCESQSEKSILGVRAKAALRKDRNEGILDARAAARPVKEVAAQYSVSTATVTRVATPLAVAAWRKHQAVEEISQPFSPPLPDDSQNEVNFLESSEHRIEKGSDISDHSWIVDTWIAAVGRAPTLRQQLQLGAWCSAGEDDLTLVDLVRMIGYARGKRDPWAYVSAGMARLAGEPEWWQSLQRRASNKQRQYASRADNPRAYLATCLRNAGDETPGGRCATRSMRLYRRGPPRVRTAALGGERCCITLACSPASKALPLG